MKKVILAGILASASSIAMADGFRCETLEGDVAVKVYNNVQPELGTRNGAVMVISDNTVQLGRRTIATFRDVHETLSNYAALYEGKVDLRFNDSSRKGENILGTKLGQLKKILVDVDFTYGSPVMAGEETAGALTLMKRNGQKVEVELVCERYLKG